jgi:hypothetical protein
LHRRARLRQRAIRSSATSARAAQT